MHREESLAYISSNRAATSLGLIPKNRIYNDEQMRSALIFSDSNARRQIIVSGMGEFSLPPDRVKLVLTIVSTKSQVNEAKRSVRRRLEYIEQTLRNHGVKEQDKSLTQTIARRETMYEVKVELTAIFIDIQRYQLVQNHLAEKLDAPVVQILEPVFYHSTLRLENLKFDSCSIINSILLKKEFLVLDDRPVFKLFAMQNTLPKILLEQSVYTFLKQFKLLKNIIKKRKVNWRYHEMELLFKLCSKQKRSLFM